MAGKENYKTRMLESADAFLRAHFIDGDDVKAKEHLLNWQMAQASHDMCEESNIANPTTSDLLHALVVSRDRIADMLVGDDGEAWLEARKVLPQIEDVIARARQS